MSAAGEQRKRKQCVCPSSLPQQAAIAEPSELCGCLGNGGELVLAALYPGGDAEPEDWNRGNIFHHSLWVVAFLFIPSLSLSPLPLRIGRVTVD